MSPETPEGTLLTEFTALTVLVLIAVAAFVFFAIRRIVTATLKGSRIPEDQSRLSEELIARKRALDNLAEDGDKESGEDL